MLANLRMGRGKAITRYLTDEMIAGCEYDYDEAEMAQYIRSAEEEMAAQPDMDELGYSPEELRQAIADQAKQGWMAEAFCKSRGIAIDEADAAAQADQMQLFMNVGSVSGIFGNMKKIAEISETAPERTEGEAVPAASEDIVFDRVSFAYTPEQDVLHDVSLRIPAGKATAIIGDNGAGKSTLFKLLTRLYEPKSGAIRFGGDNIADFALTGWRDRFAYVFQKDPLIGGTVRENITYGVDREVSEEELIAAAKKANCYDCIMAKPGGFDEDVGLGGSNFSGGQAQCISIARAMLRDADYLLLDEATSNLDVVSEAAVTEAMDHLMECRTTIMIAHNFAATRNADYIIVMKDGTVEAAGTPEELQETNEYYRMFSKTL